MKFRVKMFVLLLVILLVSGCLGASISVKISPNPIKMEFGDNEVETEIKVSTSGIGKLELGQLYVAVFDEDGLVAWEVPGRSIEFVFGYVMPGMGMTFDETLQLPPEYQYATEDEYNNELKSKTFAVEFRIVGSRTVVTTVEMQFH